MTTPQYLHQQFERCMPLFIALGDAVRLSIIEVLTREAFRHGTEGPIASMSMTSPAAPASPALLFPTT